MVVTLTKDYKKHNGRVVKKGKTIIVDEATGKELIKQTKPVKAKDI